MLAPVKAEPTTLSVGFQNSRKLWLDRRKWFVSRVCSFAFNELLSSAFVKLVVLLGYFLPLPLI